MMSRKTYIYYEGDLSDLDKRLITTLFAYKPSEIHYASLSQARKPAAWEQAALVYADGKKDYPQSPKWLAETTEPDVFVLRSNPLRLVTLLGKEAYEVLVVPPIAGFALSSRTFPGSDLEALLNSGYALRPTLPPWLLMQLLVHDFPENSPALQLLKPRFNAKRLGAEKFEITFWNGVLVASNTGEGGNRFTANVFFNEALDGYNGSRFFDELFTVRTALADGAEHPAPGRIMRYAQRGIEIEIGFEDLQ